MRVLFFLLFLLSSIPAFADSPVIWGPGGYAKNLAANGFLLSTGEYVAHLASDPSAGGGFVASIGSLGLLNNGGAGQLWVKTGAGNTAWTNALTAASGWSLTGNAGTNPAANFVGTTDANDLVLERNSAEKLRLISSGIQAANIYGDTAASGNILIDSTTNATKGNVNLGQSYKEYTSGKIRFGSVGSAVPANSDIAYNTPNHKMSFISSGGQEWQQVINDSRMFFWPFGASTIGLGVNTSNEVMAGDASGYKLTVSNNSATTVAGIGALGVSGSQPIVAIENMNATVNNFTGLMFRNQNDAWIAGMFGINENHNVIGSATGHEEIWTRNAGTAARAVNIAADKTITMDKYGAGVAQFDASGVVSSTAPSTSGNVLTSNGTAWISQAPTASGTVNTGVVGRLALYPANGTAVDDQYTQNANLIDVLIATHAGLAASRTYTIPDSGASASFVMTEGAQTINGAKTLGSQLDMSSHKIVNVTDPTAAQDAATKNYVDNGLAAINPKEAVYAASTANIVGTYNNMAAGIGATFTVTATGALSLDGTSPPLGERVLLKNQTNGFENGVYTVTVVGALGVSPILTRSLDYNQPSEMNDVGTIPVINGTVNAVTSWLQTATITTVGTDNLVFTQWTMNPSSYLQKTNNLSDVTSITTAFNNISPLTTKGDTLVHNGTNNVRFPACANGQQIQFDSTQASGIKCVTPSSSSSGGGSTQNVKFTLSGAIVPFVAIDGPHYQTTTTSVANVNISMLNSGDSGSTTVQMNQYRAGVLFSSATASLASAAAAPSGAVSALSGALSLTTGDIITVDVNSAATGNPAELSVEY